MTIVTTLRPLARAALFTATVALGLTGCGSNLMLEQSDAETFAPGELDDFAEVDPNTPPPTTSSIYAVTGGGGTASSAAYKVHLTIGAPSPEGRTTEGGKTIDLAPLSRP